MSKRIRVNEDPSDGRGIYVGDLKYGRCNGKVLDKNGDHRGSHNLPVMPLVLVEPRDPSVWRNDKLAKIVHKDAPNSVNFTRMVLDIMKHNVLTNQIKSNIHLKLTNKKR